MTNCSAYGATCDFFSAERSEWDPESLLEGRFDAERAVRRFEEANAV